MKKIVFIIFLFTLSNCSFDNKTGIWTDNNSVDLDKDKRFKDFETLYTKEPTFNKVIKPNKKLNIKLDKVLNAEKWVDKYFQNTNNFDNFSYGNKNILALKGKKLSRFKVKNEILSDGQNIITSDIKGNIIIYSLIENKVIFKFNFYKKKFKKIKKNLNIKVDNNVVFVSDNLGYLYALDYLNQKLLWAKNFRVPFRSNIKTFENKIVLSDQNNNFYVINKINGEQIKFIPTEETPIKSDFINSIAFINNHLIYLNTFGTLYSINGENLKINWFSNLKQSFDRTANNLFYSNPVIIYKNRIIVSTDPSLYVLNINDGRVIIKKSITSIVNPIISGGNLFIVTKDNLLVCINLNSGEINYSLDISKEISEYLESKNRKISVKYMYLVNNNLMIILNNSYFVSFYKNGKINEIQKLKRKLETAPVFIKQSIIFLDKNKRITVLN